MQTVLLYADWIHSCWPDPLLREVCCLPGAGVRDVMGKLSALVQPSDF